MTFNITVVLAFVGRGGRWHFGPAVKGGGKKFENHCSKRITDKMKNLLYSLDDHFTIIKYSIAHLEAFYSYCKLFTD